MAQPAQTGRKKELPRIALFIMAVAVVVFARLFSAAIETENWPGLFYSTLHVVIAAGGAYLAIRAHA
jgi:hypothetical protein